MIWMLVITTLVMGLYPPETVAMLAPALPAAAESSSDSHRMADLQKIQTVLESKVVRSGWKISGFLRKRSMPGWPHYRMTNCINSQQTLMRLSQPATALGLSSCF